MNATPTADDADRHRALAHPVRHRLLMALRSEPATISGLARLLDIRKGSVSHHLGVLVRAEMVHPTERKQIRGGTEQYYEIVAGPIQLSDPAATTAMLAAVAAQMGAADDPLLHLRHVRLTPARAALLRDVLEAVVADVPATGEGVTHGVLVGLYPLTRPEIDRQ